MNSAFVQQTFVVPPKLPVMNSTSLKSAAQWIMHMLAIIFIIYNNIKTTLYNIKSVKTKIVAELLYYTWLFSHRRNAVLHASIPCYMVHQ